MNNATQISFVLGNEIAIKSGSVILAGTISKITEKAIEINVATALTDYGKPVDMKVWFPKAALVQRKLTNDAQIRKYYEENGMDKTLGLAKWFKLNDYQTRCFNMSA